jgi:hypothetical protein
MFEPICGLLLIFKYVAKYELYKFMTVSDRCDTGSGVVLFCSLFNGVFAAAYVMHRLRMMQKQARTAVCWGGGGGGPPPAPGRPPT